MKAHYDPEVDALAINWENGLITESDEVESGVMLDYDLEGNVMGVEILNASKKVKNIAAFATTKSTD